MLGASIAACLFCVQAPAAPSAQAGEAGRAAQEAPLAERVNHAIARGVALLTERQAEDGRWPGAEDAHPGGMTALGALTLLKSGVRRSDERVRRAMGHLAKTPSVSTYAHSVRLMLYDALGDPGAWREHARVSLDALVATQQGGVWAYPTGAVDLSNTQFALLGLRAAHRMGLEVPRPTLLATLKALGRWQEREDGGFRYDDGKPATASITVATLGGYAVLDELVRGDSACEALLRKQEPDRKRALSWLVERFDVARNAWGRDAWTPGFHYPYLWAIERYGGLANQARIGEHDWYAEGAEWLVAQQETDGSWGKTEDTCFALLFLRRATVSTGGAPADDATPALVREPAVRPAADALRVGEVLVAGPWTASEFGELLCKPPFDPAKARAKEGDKLARREWKRVKLSDSGWSDLEALLATPCDRGLLAVATHVDWRGAEPLQARLWFDLEDGWDVYLDGERLSFGRRVQAAIDASLSVELELAPGPHVLVCLVEDALGAAAFGLRITAPDGGRLAEAPAFDVVPAPRKR